MIKIIIADDHRIFREGLKELLQSTGKYEIIAEASNGAELIERLANFLPDIVLIDIAMPVMDGFQAAEIINIKFPSVKMLVLSSYGDETSYYKMIEAGVKGFILKESSAAELELALEEISQSGSYFSQELLRRIIFKSSDKSSKAARNLNDISRRELQILKCLCEGLPNDEIGKKLFISPRTVEVHKSHLLEKTHSKNTLNLIIYAIKHKLVEINIE